MPELIALSRASQLTKDQRVSMYRKIECMLLEQYMILKTILEISFKKWMSQETLGAFLHLREVAVMKMEAHPERDNMVKKMLQQIIVPNKQP